MSNTYYEFNYHIVWSTKKRIEIIDEDILKLLREKISEKVKSLGAKQLEFNGYKDHCHLLASISPEISVSDFVG